MKSAFSKLSSGVYKQRFVSLDRAFRKKESTTTQLRQPKKRSVSMSAGHRNINLAGYEYKNGMFFVGHEVRQLRKLNPIKFGDEYRCKSRVGTQKFGPMILQSAPGTEAMKLIRLMQDLKQQQEQDGSFISANTSQEPPHEPWVHSSGNSIMQRKQIQGNVHMIKQNQQAARRSLQSKRLDMLMDIACMQSEAREKISSPVKQFEELSQEVKAAKEPQVSEQTGKLNNIMQADKLKMANNEDIANFVPMATAQKPTMNEDSWKLHKLMEQNKNPKQCLQQRKPSFLKWIYGEPQEDDASENHESKEKESPKQDVPSYTEKTMDFIRSLLSWNNSRTETEKKHKSRSYPPFLDDVLSEENLGNEETSGPNMDGACHGINGKDGRVKECNNIKESDQLEQVQHIPKVANISAVQRCLADNQVSMELL